MKNSMTLPRLADEEIERYSRHILLREVGAAGQRRLLAASAFVVGAGGLGSPALLYLAAAGVGNIGIADSDIVDLSNLPRQVVHRTGDVGKSKVASAAQAIREINPGCRVSPFPCRLTDANVSGILDGYDVVLDGSDNFPTRFLVADCCYGAGIPLVSAAAIRFEGQLMTVLPGKGNPCYRCFIPEPPPPESCPACSQVGVLGAVTGVMGTLQAAEALKLLMGVGELLSHRLLVYDALRCRFLIAERTVDPHCPLCGATPVAESPPSPDAGRSP